MLAPYMCPAESADPSMTFRRKYGADSLKNSVIYTFDEQFVEILPKHHRIERSRLRKRKEKTLRHCTDWSPQHGYYRVTRAQGYS